MVKTEYPSGLRGKIANLLCVSSNLTSVLALAQRSLTVKRQAHNLVNAGANPAAVMQGWCKGNIS